MASQAWMHSPWRKARGRNLLLVSTAISFSLFFALNDGRMFIDVSGAVRHPTSTAANASGDNDIYIGSFVVVPPGGYECWKLKFDNRTGRTWGGRYLDCNAATETIENQRHQKRSSTLRFRTISAAFQR